MRTRIGPLAVCVLVTLGAAPAYGFSAGVPSTVFSSNVGCNQCHSGGMAPAVLLEGPTTVDPGSTSEYTFTIFAIGDQIQTGLNVSAPDGVLSTGGSSAAGTRTVAGSGGREEITHMSPQAADGEGMVRFSFLWTAPVSFESTTLRAWGNAVNGNGNAIGDRASSADLEIFSGVVPTSTPPGPTPTPTPEPICPADLEPLEPALVSDPDAQKCQDAIGKAGTGYVSGSLKAMQKCLASFQKGKLSGDPLALCVGTSSVEPEDAATAAKVAAADAKARATIAGKCTDDQIAGLGLCATTVSGFEDCLLANHRWAVEFVIGHEFGSLVASDNAEEQKCQKAIAGAAGKFLSASLKATQKCLSSRNKQSVAGDGAALCIGSVAAGSYIPPTDAKTAAAVGQAEAQMLAKVAGSCTDAALAGLDACANDLAGLEECLVCTHRAALFDAIGVEYGGGS